MFRPTATLLALASSVLLASPLQAAERYRIDPTHTLPTWEIDHLGYSTQRGVFTGVSGTIELDRTAEQGKVNIEIDAASLSTGVAKLDTHLKGDDFFQTQRHPKITFVSSGMRFEKGEPVGVVGDLTITGISNLVYLRIDRLRCAPHPIYRKQVCGADASAEFERSRFNINKYVPYVSDRVVLRIPVEAIQEDAAK